MSELCKFPKCGYRAPTKDALTAHQKFIHEDPLAAVPEQPKPKAVGRLREVRKLPDDGISGVPLKPRAKPGLRKTEAKIRAKVTVTKKIEAARKAKAAKVEGVLIDRFKEDLREQITRTGIRKDDMTREQWLLYAVEKMRPDFVAVGREVPPVRISVGWPGGRTARLDPLGQCWAAGAVADGIAAIFITPSQDDPVQILATTRHEMIHAAGEMHHRAGFRKLAAQVGFDPQPGASGTSSTFRTPELEKKLKALYADLGPFPHARVSKGLLDGRPKVQGTRMLKVVCRRDGYAVRTTAKWIEVGLPSCPKGHPMKVVA